MKPLHFPPVITLDGPGGVGKGTLGALLAKRLAWHFLDSGALYRALALAAVNKNLILTDEQALEKLAKELVVRFNGDIWLDGEIVSHLIRSEACGDVASRIAVFPRVRAALLDKQRSFRQWPGLVTDGRDMGTVVFPEAIIKFFLTASVEERANRRYQQLKEKGQDVTLQTLLQEISERDTRDNRRVVSPLKPAREAVVLDTTGKGIEDVFKQIMEVVLAAPLLNFS